MTADPNFNGDFGTTTVSYNGVNIIFPRVRYATKMVESESQRTQKYVIITITVSGYLRHPTTADKTLAVQQLLTKLQVPGQQFLWQEQGVDVIRAQSARDSIGVSPTSYDDVLFGPKPQGVEVISNWRYMTQLRFTLSVVASPMTQYNENTITTVEKSPGWDGSTPPANQTNFSAVQMNNDTQYQSSIIDNVVAVDYSIDQDHRTVRSIAGRMTVAGEYGQWFDGGVDAAPNGQQGVVLGSNFWGRLRALNANRFISQSFAAPPTGFIRVSQNYRIMEDGVTLHYHIVDREVDGVPYGAASFLDVGVSISDEEMQLGSVEKVVWASFELPPSTSNTFDAVREILIAIMATYVISDPEALVWIYKFNMTRSSWLTNSWQIEIHCIHQVALLYEQHFAQVGLFGQALNSTGVYSAWPKAYGDAGLAGNGYNLQKIDSIGDLQITPGGGLTPSDTGGFQDGDQISEPNVTMYKEKVQVIFKHKSVSAGVPTPPGATSGGSTIHQADVVAPAIYIAWYGYKYKLNSDPDLVFPEQRFNILAQLTGDPAKDETKASPDPTLKLPKKLPARVVNRIVHSHLPLISKLSQNKLYGTNYFFVVALSSVIVNQFLAALSNTGKSIENFPFPSTLDGIIDVFNANVAGDNPKAGAGSGPTNTVDPANGGVTPPAAQTDSGTDLSGGDANSGGPGGP